MGLYRLLQAVREDGAWETWIIFMLDGEAETAVTTLRLGPLTIGAFLRCRYERRLDTVRAHRGRALLHVDAVHAHPG